MHLEARTLSIDNVKIVNIGSSFLKLQDIKKETIIIRHGIYTGEF